MDDGVDARAAIPGFLSLVDVLNQGLDFSSGRQPGGNASIQLAVAEHFIQRLASRRTRNPGWLPILGHVGVLVRRVLYRLEVHVKLSLEYDPAPDARGNRP